MNKLPLNRASRLLWAAVGTALVAAGTRRRSLWDIGCSAAGSTMLLWAFAAPAAREAYRARYGRYLVRGFLPRERSAFHLVEPGRLR